MSHECNGGDRLRPWIAQAVLCGAAVGGLIGLFLSRRARSFDSAAMDEARDLLARIADVDQRIRNVTVVPT